MLSPLSIIVTLGLLFVVRLLYVTFLQQPSERPGNVVVVLGSGGHTAEMLRWLDIVKKSTKKGGNRLRKIVFIVSATDNHSAQAAERFDPNAVVHRIPRAREVGQSYVSSVFTTLKAIFASLQIVYASAPAAIATNGPGVCVPIVAANLLLCALLGSALHPRARLLYVESFACVHHLSLSGKILIYIAQKFVLQWPELYRHLLQKHGGLPAGVISYSGPFGLDDSTTEAKKQQQQQQNTSFKPLRSAGAAGTCVVTVGSTKFDKLIAAVDSDEFEDALLRLGVTHLLIQKGATTLTLRSEGERTEKQQQLLSRTVVDYKHGLGQDIAGAALVISHAGAGTILEAMTAKTVATIVVPNTDLMANHQIELAEGLGSRGHLLFCDGPATLLALLRREDIDWTNFVPMPEPNAVDFCRTAQSFFVQ